MTDTYDLQYLLLDRLQKIFSNPCFKLKIRFYVSQTGLEPYVAQDMTLNFDFSLLQFLNARITGIGINHTWFYMLRSNPLLPTNQEF